MAQRFSLATISKATILLMSVAVVITAVAFIVSSSSAASSLAPPRWPLKRLMAKRPISSMTTMAGSRSFLTMSGDMVRTTMPVAMIITKRS